MVLPGSFSHTPVMSPDVFVYVNGVMREAIDISLQIETGGGLPDALIGSGSGIRSRTGSITFAPVAAVDEDAHPLRGSGGWRPNIGDEVRVVSVIAGVSFPRFKGRVDSVEASFFYDASISVSVTDALGDYLERVVSVEPTIRNDYASTSWVVYTALEAAGLGAIMPPSGRCVIHNHMQNGYVPTVGKRGATAGGTSGDHEYGITAISGGITVIDGEDARAGDYVCIFGRASRLWDSEVSVTFNNSHEIRLKHVRATNQLILSTPNGGTLWSGTWTGTKTLPYLALLISDKDIRVWTSEKDSVLVPSTTFSSPSYPTSSTGRFLIGVDVRFCSTVSEFQRAIDNVLELPMGWKKSALETTTVKAMRGYENVPASHIVDAWCDATLSTIWVDEVGKVNVAARDRLVNGSPARSLAMRDKVLSGGWEIGRDGKRNQVIVKGITPNLRGGASDGRAYTIAYQPSNVQELKYGEEDVEFIKIPDDEDWYGVDATLSPVADLKKGIDNTLAFNSPGRGSWWSIVYQNDKNTEIMQWTGSEDFQVRLEKLGQRTFKATHLVSGATGSGGTPKYFKATATAPSTKLYFGARGVPTPIIKANTVAQWADYSVVGSNSANDLSLQDYVLEADWWIPMADAQKYADALSSELVQDRFTFDRVEVLWNPSRQVGDSETWLFIDSEGVTLWAAQVLISGYSEKWDSNGAPSQTVDAQVKSLTDARTGKMYADRSTAYARYAETMNSGKTYDEVYAALPGKV